MRVAIDINPDPVETTAPLKAAQMRWVFAFYLVFLAGVGLIAASVSQRIRLESELAKVSARQIAAEGDAQRAAEEVRLLTARVSTSDGLAEWLTITPPAQGMMLLLTQNWEQDVTYKTVEVELEQGLPVARITMVFSTTSGAPTSADTAGSYEASARQVARIQNTLSKAGFRFLNVEEDGPTPEGWRFKVAYGLPLRGQFQDVRGPQQLH